MEVLIAYDWPGNVRQLENEIERAVVLSQGKVITSQILSLEPGRASNHIDLGDRVRRGVPLADVMSDVEYIMISEALRQAGGDREEAASLLGVSISTLQKKIHQHKLNGSH